MEARLRQAAQNLDDGKEVTTEDLHPASSTQETDGQTDGDDADGKQQLAPEKDERKTGTEADSKKKEGDGAGKNGEKKPAEETAEAKAARQQKENERYDRNWKKFQEQQEAFKQREAQLAERERRLAEQEQTRTQQRSSEPLKDDAGFTAAQYEAAAAKWEKEGKYDLADMANASAKALREQEAKGGSRGEASQPNRQPTAKPEDTPRTAEFTAKWNSNLQELIATPEFADLGNKDSELFKATAKALQSEPRFSLFNDGIKQAARIARLELEAASVPGLRTQLTEANKELDKLRKATSPGAGGTESRGGNKSFEQMTPAEQEAELKRRAAEEDGA